MVVLCATGVALGITSNASKQKYVADEYIVKVRSGASLVQVEASVAKIGGQLLRALPIADMYLVKLTSKTTNSKFTAMSRSSATSQWMIESIQPNYLYYADAIPNDKYWSFQWDKVLMGMPKVWDTEKGSSAVTVAVIDSGVAYDHPDLVDRVDKSIGYDYVDNDNDPMDENGHGTHVAGIIAAQGDNGIGVTGVCWNGVNIMPIRVLGIDGSGTSEMIVNGMEHARVHNVPIVNMSLGSYSPDEAIHSKLQDLTSQGILVVCAAGNSGDTSDPHTGYPAAYPEALAVAATGPTDKIAYYSSYGPDNQVDIAAPGGDDTISGASSMILSTWVDIVRDSKGAVTSRTLGYIQEEGTSMACPQVAGAAAILLSAGVAQSDLRAQMVDTARVPSKGYNAIKYGAGIIDLNAAMGSSVIHIITPLANATTVSNPKVEVKLLAVNIDSVVVQIDGLDAIAAGSASDYVDSIVGGISFNIPLPGGTALAPGTHNIKVTGNSKISGEALSDEVSFTVASNPVDSGIYLFAFPFLIAPATTSPADLLAGTTFVQTSVNKSKLIRWIAAPQGGTTGQPQYGYVTYNPANSSDIAWNTTTLSLGGFSWYVNGGYFNSTGPGTSQITHPIVGSGYWLVLPTDTQINENLPTLEGRVDFDPSKGYIIRLYTGWNIIGNPYPRKVSWQTCLFKYRGETKGLLSAVDAGWLSAIAYGYDSTISRDYRRVTSRDSLDEYRGYWVRSYVGDVDNPLELIVVP